MRELKKEMIYAGGNSQLFTSKKKEKKKEKKRGKGSCETCYSRRTQVEKRKIATGQAVLGERLTSDRGTSRKGHTYYFHKDVYPN